MQEKDYKVFKTWQQGDLTIYGYTCTSNFTGRTYHSFKIEDENGTDQEIPSIGLMSKDAVIDFVENYYKIEPRTSSQQKEKKKEPPVYVKSPGGIFLPEE